MQSAFFMFNKIQIVSAVFAILVMCSCSRNSTGIHSIWSYYKINSPGIIPVDDNGNAITVMRDTLREIYIVTKSSIPPEVIAVVLNKQSYAPVVSKNDSNKIYVGERLLDNQPVEINARPGYSLWKISVAEAKRDLVIVKEKTHPRFYLYLKNKGRNRIKKITSSLELVPELHY